MTSRMSIILSNDAWHTIVQTYVKRETNAWAYNVMKINPKKKINKSRTWNLDLIIKSYWACFKKSNIREQKCISGQLIRNTEIFCYNAARNVILFSFLSFDVLLSRTIKRKKKVYFGREWKEDRIHNELIFGILRKSDIASNVNISYGRRFHLLIQDFKISLKHLCMFLLEFDPGTTEPNNCWLMLFILSAFELLPRTNICNL